MFGLPEIRVAALEEAVRQMPAAAVIAEAPSGKLILINEQARQLLERNAGWSGLPEPGEIGDFGDLRMFRPDGRPVDPTEWPLVRSIRSGEEVRGEEHSYLLADGSRLTIRSDASPIHDDEGRIVAGVLIVRDVTEQKRSEEELRASGEQFRATFEQAAVGMSHTAPDGRLLRVNRKLCDILGYTREELLEMTVQERTHPDDLDKDLDQARQLLAGEIETYSMEKRLFHKDGSIVWIKLTISLVRDPAGEPDYFIAVCEDVDERKRAEEQLAYHARLLENVQEAVIAMNERFDVTAWNKGAEGMYGWREDEALGRNVWEVVPIEANEERRAEGRRALAETGRFRAELIAHRKDGSPIHTEVTIVALRGERGEITGYLSIDRDITERKRFEEKQQRLADIVQTSSDFIGIADLDGQVTFVNDAGQRLVGLNGIEEVRRTRVWDYFFPEDRAFVRDEILPGVMESGSWSGEMNFRHFETGEPIPVMWEHFRIDDPNTGEPICVATVTRDMTERKRAEEALRESEARYRHLFTQSAESLLVHDAEGEIVDCNDKACAAHGYTRQQMLSLRIQDLTDTLLSETEKRLREESGGTLWQRALAGESMGPEDFHVGEHIRKGGKRFSVEVWVSGITYGEQRMILASVRDITERKRAEEEIETSARQQAAVAELGLRALANHGLQSVMDEAVTLVAWTLEVEYAKIVDLLRGGEAGGEELFLRAGVGWREGLVGSIEEAELDPQSVYTLRSDEPVIVEDLSTEARFSPAPILSEHGVVSTMTAVIPGRERPFGVLGAYTESHRIFSEDDVNFLQAVANVLATRVEREEAEEELREVREAERSRMARDLHDEALRDLTYALAEAQHVQSTLKELTPVHRLARLVAALRRTGQQLRGAIYDLRLGGEQDRPFSELLESLVERHRTMAPECDIRLDAGDGTLQRPLRETGTELLRIVGEALTNARRHSEAHNVSVAVWASEEKLFAEVSDDGRGFDPARERPASHEATGGTGIKGMRERARARDGDLRIESQPEGGAKVRIELALEKNRKEPREKPDQEELENGEEEPRQKVRILLVEDHAAVREAIASSFEQEAGFEVVGQAASLAQARRMLEAEPGNLAEPVDVAVVDLGLPDGYGGELIGELREANPEAQVLVLSANLDRAEVARAVESGAAGVLHKTVHLDEVVQAVRRLRAGETLVPMEEVVELLRFAGSQREEEYEARQAIARLTPREREVLQALTEGLDGEGIAGKLGISLRTERNHIASILAKLGVHSQLQALVFALRHGVVEIRQ